MMAPHQAGLPGLAARDSRAPFARRHKQLPHEDGGYGLALEGLSATGCPASLVSKRFPECA